MKTVRLDNFELPVVKTTDQGFLKGKAVVTKTGVFKYNNPDGTQTLELRHPDDVFNKQSLESLESVPITIGHPDGIQHPDGFINSKNANELMVGMTGETVSVEDEFVVTSLNITNDDAIKKIKNGKQELSLGYGATIVEEEGVYNNQPYTHRQKDIKYNHLAIVDVGRAGRSVRLVTTDSSDDDIFNNNKGSNTMDEKNLEKIVERLEALEGSVQKRHDEEAAVVLEEAAQLAETLEEKVEELTEKLEEAQTKAKTVNEEALQEKVTERAELMVKVNGIMTLEDVEALSNREIMETAIKIATNGEDDLSTRADEYVVGRFDALTAVNHTEDSGESMLAKQMANITFIKAPTKPEVTLSELQAEIYKKCKEGK